MLFVHGWPVSGATFRRLLPHLTEHVTCHLLDLPGAGDSPDEAATFAYRTLAAPMLGTLGDRWGPRRVLALMRLGYFTASGVIFVLAASGRLSPLAVLVTASTTSRANQRSPARTARRPK